MPSCIGILSNGVRWKFFHVERIGPKFKASSTRNLHEADEGLIVELVKNAVRARAGPLEPQDVSTDMLLICLRSSSPHLNLSSTR